jgi:hypothetical protein
MTDYERGFRAGIEAAARLCDAIAAAAHEDHDYESYDPAVRAERRAAMNAAAICADAIRALTPPSPPSVPSATCAMCDRLRAAARDAAARLNTIGYIATTDAAQIFDAVGEDPVIPPCKTCGGKGRVCAKCERIAGGHHFGQEHDTDEPCPDCAPASVATARGEATDIAPEGTDNALPTERAKAESPADAKAATCATCDHAAHDGHPCSATVGGSVRTRCACGGSGVRR